MDLNGIVSKKTVAAGSKSEREAVVIETSDGEFLLRRAGGNPFSDPELDALVGQELRCSGTLHGQYFIMTEWSRPDDGA